MCTIAHHVIYLLKSMEDLFRLNSPIKCIFKWTMSAMIIINENCNKSMQFIYPD